MSHRPYVEDTPPVDTEAVPSKRAIAKEELVDIESRLAPFFPQPLAAESPTRDGVARGWLPPLR